MARRAKPAGTVTCHREMTKIHASPQKGGVSTNQSGHSIVASWGGVKDVKKLVKDVCGALWTVKLTSLESRQRL